MTVLHVTSVIRKHFQVLLYVGRPTDARDGSKHTGTLLLSQASCPSFLPPFTNSARGRAMAARYGLFMVSPAADRQTWQPGWSQSSMDPSRSFLLFFVHCPAPSCGWVPLLSGGSSVQPARVCWTIHSRLGREENGVSPASPTDASIIPFECLGKCHSLARGSHVRLNLGGSGHSYVPA